MKIIKKIFITSALLTSICFANTIHVPDDYPTIQLALNYASSFDTVLVQSGIYKENIVWPSVIGVKLLCTDIDSRPIIDGGRAGSVIEFPKNYIVDTTTVIEGFVIKNGNATNNGYPSYGGGINGLEANPKLGKLLVANNNGYRGGGICLSGSSIDSMPTVLYEIELMGNEASYGAAIYFESKNYLKITDITATNNGDPGDCVIYFYLCDAVEYKFNDITIFNNIGHGIGCEGGNPILDKISVVNNGSIGIELINSNPKIDNCLIANTEKFVSCAIGIRCYQSSPMINNCTITQIIGENTQCSIGISGGNSSFIVSNSNICYNTTGAENGDEQIFLNAENNWWGHYSGPYHQTSNPGGIGNAVNLYVDVIPFLTSPDTVAPPPIIQNLLIDTIGVDFARLKWDSSPIGDLKGYRLYINGSPTVYSFSDTIDVGNDTICTLDNLITGKTYYVSVTCYDNSGDESWFVKTLPVMPSPVSIIDTELDQIDFGTVLVGDKAQKSLVIHNTGTADLNIINIGTTSSEFLSSETTLIISPNSQSEIILMYIPTDFGTDSVELVITSDAYNDSEYTISLIGFGDLSPSPEISSIVDIPNDQGGNVRISFLRSKYDGIDSTCKIVSYTVWRLIEENDWDAVGMFNAVQDSFYNFVAPTLGDSTVHGIVWSTFKVSAHTENPDIFFYSDSLSGYSIDNIAPGVPEGLLASTSNGNILLTWQPNIEKDFQHYGIYRSTCSNFDPDTMEIYTYATSDTFLYDSNIEGNINYYYRVSAFDYSDNESEYSPEVSAFVVGLQSSIENVPGEYSLSQNYPNPFNPTTTIIYGLPKISHVNIRIYDLLGREVTTLVNNEQEAKHYKVIWDAKDRSGNDVPGGMYLYRIVAKSGDRTFVKTRKLLLMR
ncbi:MAG: T9SS type A sorting domain-containing protein [Bacteroidota bacterium]